MSLGWHSFPPVAANEIRVELVRVINKSKFLSQLIYTHELAQQNSTLLNNFNITWPNKWEIFMCHCTKTINPSQWKQCKTFDKKLRIQKWVQLFLLEPSQLKISSYPGIGFPYLAVIKTKYHPNARHLKANINHNKRSRVPLDLVNHTTFSPTKQISRLRTLQQQQSPRQYMKTQI